MKNRQITLLDLGLDESFNAAMVFVQGVLSSVNAGFNEPVLDVDFVRSRDLETNSAAMLSKCTVLHVMAHGDHSEYPAFTSSDGNTEVDLELLAECVHEMGVGIRAGTVIADGCKTGIGVWQRAIRDSLQAPITYVGTSAMIGWHESTVFCSAFYGALTRNKGRGLTASEQGMDAALRAIEAYESLTDKKCPYRAVTLTPSAKAVRALRLR